MNPEIYIASIEHSIERAKEHVATKDAVERLTRNRDFKKVILEGYFEQEAIRLVHLKADPEFQTPEKQAELHNEMLAIAGLRAYLDRLIQIGKMEEAAIPSHESELDALRSEV